MARRLRLPSWVEDEPTRPKAVEPLRYRISPNEKKLDQLDSLEAELERLNGQICPDEYDYLRAMLDAKRNKLAKARERDLGIETPRGGATLRASRKKHSRGLAGASRGHSLDWLIPSNGVWWALACLVSFLIIF